MLTSSLGLGAGDWLPGLDLHLNSMLGEADLIREPLRPGERMGSMMSPTLALDGDGPVLAGGAAGGTRLRSALVQVLAGTLDEGLSAEEAVERPRLHPAAGVVHLEPGWPDEVPTALEAAGYVVRVWPDRHHYFGGVSVVTRTGAAGDPTAKRRRSDPSCAADRRPAEVAALRTARVRSRPCPRRPASCRRWSTPGSERTGAPPASAGRRASSLHAQQSAERLPKLALSYFGSFGVPLRSAAIQPTLPQTGQGSAWTVSRGSRYSVPQSRQRTSSAVRWAHCCSIPDQMRPPAANLRRR